MKREYLISEIAKMFNITKRTLQYYDKIELLQPSFIKENGYRVYGDEELAKFIEISIDDNEAVDNGKETTYDAGILSEGNHHIKVVALDNHGEVLDSSSTTLVVQS